MNIYFILSCNPIMLYLFYCLNHSGACCRELCQLAPGPCEQMPVVRSLILALSTSALAGTTPRSTLQAHCVNRLPSPESAISLKCFSSCYWKIELEPEIHMCDDMLSFTPYQSGGNLPTHNTLTISASLTQTKQK